MSMLVKNWLLQAHKNTPQMSTDGQICNQSVDPTLPALLTQHAPHSQQQHRQRDGKEAAAAAALQDAPEDPDLAKHLVGCTEFKPGGRECIEV
jgi:hypothetical protein